MYLLIYLTQPKPHVGCVFSQILYLAIKKITTTMFEGPFTTSRFSSWCLKPRNPEGIEPNIIPKSEDRFIHLQHDFRKQQNCGNGFIETCQWIGGKIVTWNHIFSHQIYGFSAIFPLNQSIDTWWLEDFGHLRHVRSSWRNSWNSHAPMVPPTESRAAPEGPWTPGQPGHGRNVLDFPSLWLVFLHRCSFFFWVVINVMSHELPHFLQLDLFT